MLFEVSVVVITYNRPEGLLKALESVFSQTFLNFEVIVVDNGSTTDTYSYVPSYITSKSNFDYIRFDQNENVSKRLNQALTLSRGRYITFLTDDAFWCPEALEELYDAIKIGVDLVSGRVKTLDYKSGFYLPNNYGCFTWPRGELKTINPIHLSSVIVSRDLINDVGGFNENVKKSYDLDLWNRVYCNDSYITGRIDEVISHVAINHPNSLSKYAAQDLDNSQLTNPNPLKGNIGRRFVVSLNENNHIIKDFINKLKYNLIIVENNKYSDFKIDWDIDNFEKSEYYNYFNFLCKNDIESLGETIDFKISEKTYLKRLLMYLQYKITNNNFKNIYLDYTMKQMRGGNFINLSPGSVISQYVQYIGDSSIKGIQVYIDPQENNYGKIACIVISGIQKRMSVLENQNVCHGWTTFLFDEIKVEGSCELIFSFKSDVSFFSIEYAKFKNTLGVMLLNKKPLKSCLRFRLL